MTTRLNFATEASHAAGLGHFMRCYALAEEAAANGLRSHFMMSELPEPARQRLATIGASSEQATSGLEAACMARPLTAGNWWIADSYQISAVFLSQLHQRGRLLVFDDLCALPHYDCELLVNASPMAPQARYAARSSANLLLGPAWSPVRREFRGSQEASQTGRGTDIAVMIGGSDPRGLSLQIARCLRQHFPDRTVQLILGPAFLAADLARAEAHALGGVTVHQNPTELAPLLASAALVVTAAGGSIGELCALRQMAIALVVVDNQAGALQSCPYPTLDARRALPEEALARVLTQALSDAPGRQQTITQAHALVDGRGCSRLLEAMLGG
jgi:spore coat polysaccharide biosynthesis predicted glycosyltransferase SpsG